MSNNNVNTLCRIDQAIRGLNDDGTDDSYVPAQSSNGALERIEKSIKELDIKGIKSGLPKVTNADNGKVLQVKNGKWRKGDEFIPSEPIYANDFAEHFDEYALKDAVYLVDGTVEPYTRFNESIDSAEEANLKVFAGPSNPSVVIVDHLPWQAFSDNEEHGFSTVYDESEGSYLQYVFDYPQHVRAISLKLKYETNLDEPPTIPVEIYVEVHDGQRGWKDRTLLFRGNIDEDFEYTWYPLTSEPLSVTDSIRFINTSPLSDNLTYVVSIANIQLFDASSELDTGDRSIWYKGICYGEGETSETIDIPVIKSFDYTGTNNTSTTIIFPEKPVMVLGIQNSSADSRGYMNKLDSFVWGASASVCCWRMTDRTNLGSGIVSLEYDETNDKKVTLYGNDSGIALNYDGALYTVYYMITEKVKV